MNKLLLPLLLLLTAPTLKAQHAFEYVCETDAMQFFIDRYTATTHNGYIEVWEERILQKNEAGQAEARRIQSIYPSLNLAGVASYYIKMEVDTVRRQTRTVSLYFFDGKRNEIGSSRPDKPAPWEVVVPETVGELEMNHIIKIARHPQLRPDMR